MWPDIRKLPLYPKLVLKQATSQLRAKFTSTYGSGASLTEAGLQLLEGLLAYDPARRMTADEALAHRCGRRAPLPRLAGCVAECQACECLWVLGVWARCV